MNMLRRKFPIFLFLLTSYATSSATDTLNTTQILRDGSDDTLISSGGSFELGFFSPESSTNRYLGVWYKKISERTVVWVANRDYPLTDRLGVLTLVQPRNILALLNSTNATIWSTNTSRNAQGQVIAQLLDSGNLVVRDGDDENPEDFFWQSFDYPTDTFLPGMKLGKNFVTGVEVYITSWKSSGDPASGEFTHHFDPAGFPQSNIKKGRVFQYKTGPWNGVGFSGLPNLKKNTIFRYEVVISESAVYYHYELLNESVITRFALSESGVGHRWIWVDRTQEWISYLTLPVDNCDVYNACGSYGSCNPENTPFCGCLRKFKPKDPQGWNGGDYANGCVRSEAFNCQIGDAFLKYSGLKLPDTEFSWYNESMSLEDCEVECSRNCSCTAYSRLNISSGNGCLLWFGDIVNMRAISPGQEIYIRMASSELESAWKKHRRLALSLSSGSGVLLLSLFLGLLLYRRKRRKETGMVKPNNIANHPDESAKDLEIPRFDLQTICNATDNFSSNNTLGQGGYGTVYKGVLGDGVEIAVKCGSRTSLQGVEAFINEVKSIAKLQHRNLVKLIGCCTEGDERMLVYEYLTNKSLDLILFDSNRKASLDWPKRFSIIKSIARGLQYLHEDSRLRVIHRDLKTGNILLDSEMNPKISDFGLARTFGGNETGDITGRLMGTHGYIAPEYLAFGQFSVKSDVFSFGVIVLEIVSGERNRVFPHGHGDHPPQNLLGHAWRLHREDKLEELIDLCVGRSHLSEMLRSIHVGLVCVQEHPDDRPSMSSVVQMLSNAVALPQPKHPALLTRTQIETPLSIIRSLILS